MTGEMITNLRNRAEREIAQAMDPGLESEIDALYQSVLHLPEPKPE